ncbi:hypothetical protein D3C86_1831260 [compost metagenome]
MRLCSMPFAARRGLASVLGLTSAWISTSKGRVPSMVGTMAEPVVSLVRSARKTAEGLVTSIRPASCISKRPTSLVEPKRFLTARTSR